MKKTKHLSYTLVVIPSLIIGIYNLIGLLLGLFFKLSEIQMIILKHLEGRESSFHTANQSVSPQVPDRL